MHQPRSIAGRGNPQACNRAAYRGTERTTDLFEAVSRLGFYELYDIIATSTGTHGLPPDAPAAPEALG